MTDKVTPLFGAGNQENTIQNSPAKSYNIKMKSGTLFENQIGYLSINGLFAVLTDQPNDALAVNFYALLEDIDYIVESDEALDAE